MRFPLKDPHQLERSKRYSSNVLAATPVVTLTGLFKVNAPLVPEKRPVPPMMV